MRPRIAIVLAEDWTTPYYKIHKGFIDYIVVANGLPLCLPCVKEPLAEEFLKQFDGLIVTGGGDVNPDLYNEKPSPLLSKLETRRDAMEPNLIHIARQLGMPILCICRGYQMLNVVLGGTLWQDLSEYPTETLRHTQSESTEIPTHSAAIIHPKLSQIFGRDQLDVNTHHHQAIKQLASDLEVAALAPDGVIEAVVARDHNLLRHYCVGIQWHPERMGPLGGGPALFSSLVNAATYYAEANSA